MAHAFSLAGSAVCVLMFLSGCSGQQPFGMRANLPLDGLAMRVKAAAPIPAESAGTAEGLKAPPMDPARAGRLVVYNAELYVVVANISDALNRAKAVATAMGGYLQAMDADSITVKVPATKFDDAIAAMEKLGEVTRKEIKGTDVTEQMQDLQIRLKNAKDMRERLSDLLKRAEKVEDALKIEKELERVAGEVELLEGKIQYLETNVAFSTLTVHVNSPVPQREITPEARAPIAWIRGVATDMLRGYGGEVYTGFNWWNEVSFKLPESYALYYEKDWVTRAMSADGVFLLVERHENFKGGDVKFWSEIIRRELAEQKSILISEESDIRMRHNVPARLITGKKEIAGKVYGYMIAIGARTSYVYTYEAWGPETLLANQRDALQKSMESVHIRLW